MYGIRDIDYMMIGCFVLQSFYVLIVRETETLNQDNCYAHKSFLKILQRKLYIICYTMVYYLYEV